MRPVTTLPPPAAAAPALLVVDDDELVCRSVERSLTRQGYRVVTAGNGDDALEAVAAFDFDVALIDVHLPGIHGLDLLAKVREASPTTECIIFTSLGDVSIAYASLEAGASDYLEKPIADWPRFQRVLDRAAEVRRLKRQTEILKRGRRGPTPLIGNSAAMERLRALIGSVGPSQASLLIVGESGAGKELVAEAIHRESGRRGELVRINCASVPHDLMESELFGSEKGAHSTATHAKEGLFEVAAGGTVLLDEIGDMPLDLQAKLLRVLESKKIRRLGGTHEREMTARVVAATNHDVERAVAAGRFRQDLWFRINVVTLTVPPLRERKEDIPLLTYHFVRSFNESERRDVQKVPPEVLDRLEAHDWPGNVRELRNVVHRAVLLSDGATLSAASLGPAFSRSDRPPAPAVTEAAAPMAPDVLDLPYAEAKEAVLQEFTERYVSRRLAASGGNVSRAAEAAGMLRPNFKRLMRQHGISGPKDD
jgi:DNA-binding NtrC family response regulator